MADNFFGITDKGKMRDNNEDTFIARVILQNRYILACVIDGVGGYEGGEIASALANETILAHLQKPFTDVIHALKNAVIAANENIYKRKLKDDANNQMACVLTLALVDVEENKFYYAHVGDTRLYLLRDRSLVKVSNDHSFVGFLEDSGRLTEEAAMHHPKRNEINKALGFDEQQFLQPDYIETAESPFLPADILLLCSDGLSDMINQKTITSILASNKKLKEKGKALINAANEAGGKDNITVVLVENDKSPQTHEATKPVITSMQNIATVNKTEPQNETEKVPVKEKNISSEFVNKESAKQKTHSKFLIFLCLVLMIAVGWFIYKDYIKNELKPQPKAVMPPHKKTINFDEQKLADSLNKVKNVFLSQIINVQPLIFNDSVIVSKDSVHIHGNNSIIVADSSYKGAAFVFSGNCKYILIDSVTLQDFNIGIVAKNNALHLKDVQFKNCGVSIRHEIISNEKTVSGKFLDSLSSTKKDSAKTKR